MPINLITKEEVPTASSADIVAALPHLASCRALLISTLEKRARKAGETFVEHIAKALNGRAAPATTTFKIPGVSKLKDDTEVQPILIAVAADKDWNFKTMGDAETFARDFCDARNNGMNGMAYGDLSDGQQRSLKMILQRRARYHADNK